MKNWLYLHSHAIGIAVRRLLRQPVGTLLSALVVGIALSLPAAGYLLLDNVASLARGVSGSPELSIFLSNEASRADIAAMDKRLGTDGDVASYVFVSRDEAMRQLERSGLGDVLGGLAANPLPDAFVVTPAAADPALYQSLLARFGEWDKVEHVQLDSAWVERLHALLELGKSSVLLLALLLGIAMVIVTFNTIRLQILTQRHEIDVSRLLGATDPFIRRPFYWFGSLQGLLGGVVALATVWLAVYALAKPVEGLAATYGAVFSLSGPGAQESVALLAFAALLGWCGSELSVRRHLREKLS
ncbi:MAG: permease-like cell division protein FtsX [Pseudazoarcus pumilus]|nr:permease-like cell division protein FtsX [Pseudazoarcus pumilus]